MKVTKEEYDAQMANDQTALGFCLTMNSGATGSTPAIQHFLVEDGDAIKEIGRMNGYGIGLLLVSKVITQEQSGEFRLKWRKILRE